MGTSTTSELSHAVGVTLAALVKLKLLPTTGIDINAENTSGSRDNIRLLRAGDIDFAILTSLDAHQAVRGVGAFAGDEPDSGLRALTNLWQETYHFVVRKGLIPGGEFSALPDQDGLRMALGEPDSSSLTNSRALFEALNVDIDEAFEVQNLGNQAAAAAFLRGELDAFLLKTGASDLDLLSFLDEAGDEAMLLHVEEDDIQAANEGRLDVWSSVDIPLGSYPGQTRGQRAFATSNLLAASDRVDDEIAYQITRTIFDNLPILQGMHSATDGINLQYALEQIGFPLHPGAERYYREIGINLPEPEPIRVSNLAKTDFLARFQSVEQARLELHNGNVSILGGQDGETIGRFTSELAGDLQERALRVMGMTSPDPANNIAQVLYAKGVDTALVPLDILNYALEENVYPDMQNKLVYVSELFPQEFHLVTSRAITDIDDLVDLPVNLGTRGSGSEFTASFLFDRLNIPIEPTYHEPQRALDLLKKGELAAVVMIAGKPVPLLQQISLGDGLHLLEIPGLKDVAYRPATMTAVDYPSLLNADETVDTFAVRTALITYNWRTDNLRYATLSNFITAFFDRLASLPDDSIGLHPKWNDINPFAELEGWNRFPAAETWLNNERQPVNPETGQVDG